MFLLGNRLDLERISSELDQAKESYVVLSEETRWIEKQTRERCDEETRQKIEEVKKMPFWSNTAAKDLRMRASL